MTNEEFLTHVGMEFKIARIRKKKSIPQLAEQTGLCEASIQRLERGKHDAHILTYKRIADVLEVELKTFVQ